jgi:hypothetical protein
MVYGSSHQTMYSSNRNWLHTLNIQSFKVEWAKNWLRSATTISSGTFGVQPGRDAQPQVSGNGPAKNN